MQLIITFIALLLALTACAGNQYHVLVFPGTDTRIDQKAFQ